ncbi:MAG: tetratricopeptide repeat protein [Planctomycetaceae bacterium]
MFASRIVFARMPDPVDYHEPPAVPAPIDVGYDPGLDFSLLNPLTVLQHPVLLLGHPVALLFAGLWVWMLIHCARHDPERGLWLWILFIGSIPAAVIYFLIRWLPGARISAGSSLLARWTKGRQIPRLEAAARNIGNPHQFVELGEAYRETGKAGRAADAFRQALAKDAESLPALWGAAQVEMQLQDFASARGHLEQILAKDSGYKFGDVSLAYCRALCATQQTDLAREKLAQHLKRWTHPEAYVLLATILIEQGDHAAARHNLESTILDLRGGPAFFARQNRGWARKAKRLLAKLPRSA